jgi:hypothetical protein
VQYLSNNRTEEFNKLLSIELSGYNLGLSQGIVQGIDQFLELGTELQRYKEVQDAVIFKPSMAKEVYQAVSEGKTHF